MRKQSNAEEIRDQISISFPERKAAKRKASAPVKLSRNPTSELALVADDSLADSEFGTLLKCGFICGGGESPIVRVDQRSKDIGIPEPKFNVFFDVLLPGLMIWTFRSTSYGGRCSINSNNVEVKSHFAYYFDSSEFVRLASSSGYEELIAHIFQVKQFAKTICNSTIPLKDIPLIILVANIEKELLTFQTRQNRGITPVNVDDCCVTLLLEHNANVIKAKAIPELIEYLQNATKVLGDALHKAPKQELDCVKRLPRRISEDTSNERRELLERKKIWINMLRMLPGMSENRAAAFVSKHSCPRKLMETSCSKENNLLADSDSSLQFQYDFTESSDNSTLSKKRGTSQKKLSKLVYSMVTCINSNELIDDGK